MTAQTATPRRTGPVWPWIAPFAVFIVLLGLEPYLADLVEPVLDPRWLYAFRAGVTALVLLALWKHYVELRETPATSASAWMGDPDPFDPRVDGTLHLGFALTRLAGAALVVPVMEELFWRSFLMRWLERPAFRHVLPRDIGIKPLLITSAIFAVEHRLWFAGLLAGLLYGELYRRTGDIRVVILAHAITNLLLGLYVLATGHFEFW